MLCCSKLLNLINNPRLILALNSSPIYNAFVKDQGTPNEISHKAKYICGLKLNWENGARINEYKLYADMQNVMRLLSLSILVRNALVEPHN